MIPQPLFSKSSAVHHSNSCLFISIPPQAKISGLLMFSLMVIKIYLYKTYILQLRQTLMASLSMQIASLETYNDARKVAGWRMINLINNSSCYLEVEMLQKTLFAADYTDIREFE